MISRTSEASALKLNARGASVASLEREKEKSAKPAERR